MIAAAVWREGAGAAAVALALISYPPYLLSVLRGRTKPHAFSWLIWTLLTWIAFAIQLSAHAGPGAWATACTALCSGAIAAATYWHGERDITSSDRWSFAGGLLAIPLWVATKDPTASAVLVSLIDSLGFWPTIRKSWHRPREEFAATHLISLFKHALSIAALTVISIPTAFYPACLFVMNIVLVGVFWLRRRS